MTTQNKLSVAQAAMTALILVLAALLIWTEVVDYHLGFERKKMR